jgi:D-cysteine desulfhydrase
VGESPLDVLEPLSLPTPVRACGELSLRRAELWLKHDGFTHSLYGGNKARKIVRFLEHAAAIRATRLLTFGAAGSHHVLTATLFGRAWGFRVAAVITGRPASAHAHDVQAAALAAGLEPYWASRGSAAPFAFARAFRPADYVIPPGGSNVRGALAYANAVGELAEQIARNELPEPDIIVVPCGSGGTAAGVLAGIVRFGLNARVLALMVLRNPLAHAQLVGLAQLALRASGKACQLSRLSRLLEVEGSEIGSGYGVPTLASEQALETARRELGLELDPTYTAKAFAGTLRLLERIERSGPARPLRVLYWHTLSAVGPPLQRLGGWVPDQRRDPA